MGCPVKYIPGAKVIGLTFDEPKKEASSVVKTEEAKAPVKKKATKK